MHSQVCWRLDTPGRSDEGHEGTPTALTHARVGCRSVINSDGQMLCLSLNISIHLSVVSFALTQALKSCANRQNGGLQILHDLQRQSQQTAVMTTNSIMNE